MGVAWGREYGEALEVEGGNGGGEKVVAAREQLVASRVSQASQYLYFCTSKASKVGTLSSRVSRSTLSTVCWSVEERAACVGLVQHSSGLVQHSSGLVQHSSAYVRSVEESAVCIGLVQHSSAYVSIRQHTSAYVSIRQHTSVSIRQHTSRRRSP